MAHGLLLSNGNNRVFICHQAWFPPRGAPNGRCGANAECTLFFPVNPQRLENDLIRRFLVSCRGRHQQLTPSCRSPQNRYSTPSWLPAQGRFKAALRRFSFAGAASKKF